MRLVNRDTSFARVDEPEVASTLGHEFFVCWTISQPRTGLVHDILLTFPSSVRIVQVRKIASEVCEGVN